MNAPIYLSVRSHVSVAYEAITEAAAMFVGAAIPNSRSADGHDSNSPKGIVTAVSSFAITQKEKDHFQIQCEWNPNRMMQAFAEIYLLVVGMRLANLSVACAGEFANLLPAEMKPANRASEQVVFRRIGFDHDKKASSKSHFSQEQLVQWYRYFGSITSLDQANQTRHYPGKHMLSDHCYVWKLPEGLMIKSKVENERLVDHQVLGCTFPLNAIRSGLPLSRPECRRTWGEAWLPHDASGQILTGLIQLSDEIAIVTDRIHRYHIEEPSSVDRRAMTFGKGASSSFPFAQWIQFAQHYHSKKNSKLAVLCLTQANLLAETAEQRMSVSTLLSSMRPPRRLRIPHSQKLRRVAFGQLDALVGSAAMDAVLHLEKQREDAYAFSDYGRIPWEVPQADNSPVPPKTAKEAGMTQEVLELMLNRKVGAYFPDFLNGLFSFQFAGRKIWGGRDTGVYFVEGIADTVFRN